MLSASPAASASTPKAGFGEGGGFCASAVPGGKKLGASFDDVYACGPADNSGTGYEVPSKGIYKGFFEGAPYSYQCTELADRVLFDVWGKMPVYGMNLDGKTFASTVHARYKSVPLIANGTAGKPYLPGDIVSFTGNSKEPDGHVAVVTKSTENASGNGKVTIIEENAASSGQETLTVSHWSLRAAPGAWVTPHDFDALASSGTGHSSALAYVVNGSSGTVTPIETDSNTALKPIKVGSDPCAIAITPDDRTAYVVNSGSNNVTPINIATDTPGAPIKVGQDPAGIAITPDGRTAYVSNLGSGAGTTVTPIHIATNTPGKAIVVGRSPQDIAITPNGKTAYVANAGSNDTVTPIQAGTNTPSRAIKVGNNPGGIAFTPDGKTAYVANWASNTVTPIRTASNTPEKSIATGDGPGGTVVTADGKTAYVVDSLSNGLVTPIDTTTNTAEKSIHVTGHPEAIAITPDGRTAYVAAIGSQSGSVTPIRTSSNDVGKAIKVPDSPVEIAIRPDGKEAYVLSSSANVVTPINTITHAVGKEISVGKFPITIVFTITPRREIATSTAVAGARHGSFGCPAPSARNPRGDALEAFSAAIRGGMDLRWAAISPSVDFTDTTTTFLADDPANWPGLFRISGLTYERFERPQPGSTVPDCVMVSRW